MADFEPGLFITVFADASWCPDTQAYGYGWWMKYGSPPSTARRAGGGYIDSSNNAEIEALRAALLYLRTNLLDEMQDKVVVVQSDCTGALKVISNDLLDLRKAGARNAYAKHVKGHQGHKDARSSVNTWCDRAARGAMRQFRALRRSEA